MVSTEGRSYFDLHYGDYERQTSQRKLLFYLTLVRRWVPPGRPIYEIGVGMGHFLKEAVNLYECSGCDINPYAIATTKERAPRATLHLGPFESAPIQVKQSAVVCWDVLEHVPDLGHTLAAINKALDQDGVLLGVVPVYDGPLGWLVRRLDHDPTHVSKFSRWDWLAELERHSFQVVEWGGIIRRLLFSRYYLHLKRPQWLLRSLGSAIYFVSRRHR